MGRGESIRKDPLNVGRDWKKSKTYGFVIGVDKDDLVILVDTVLVNPVRVQDSQVTATPANALLRDAPQSSLGLEVVHTLMDGFAVGGTCEAS